MDPNTQKYLADNAAKESGTGAGDYSHSLTNPWKRRFPKRGNAGKAGKHCTHQRVEVFSPETLDEFVQRESSIASKAKEQGNAALEAFKAEQERLGIKPKVKRERPSGRFSGVLGVYGKSIITK